MEQKESVETLQRAMRVRAARKETGRRRDVAALERAARVEAEMKATLLTQARLEQVTLFDPALSCDAVLHRCLLLC